MVRSLMCMSLLISLVPSPLVTVAATTTVSTGEIARTCGTVIGRLTRKADDAHVVADENGERSARQQLALAYYRCAQHTLSTKSEHLHDVLILRYAQQLYAALPKPLSSSAVAQLGAVLGRLQRSHARDVQKSAGSLLAQVHGPAPQATPNVMVACKKSGFAESVVAWENDFRAYATQTDASSAAYNNAVRQSTSATYSAPYTIAPAWRNLINAAAQGQQQAATQRAVQSAQGAFAEERNLLATMQSAEQDVLKTQALIHATGALQTDSLSDQIVKDIEAITQYSATFTAEGHLGQAGADDLNRIKASKLDYDDAARQLVQLPYCAK